MKRLLFSILFLTLNAMADADSLNLDHQELLKQHGIGSEKYQSYCYFKDGVVTGHRVNDLQRIASVTKLYTTLFAAETMDLNQTFKTRIHISKDQLHIEGGNDPFFEEEKLLLLIQELNRLGYKSFKKVTFDSNFLFSDAVLDSYTALTTEHVRLRLAYYLNPKNKTGIKTMWSETLKFAAEEGVTVDATIPSLNAGVVSFSKINPITENALVWNHESLPFHTILKSMNVLSKNLVAHNVFAEASKVKAFAAMMLEKGISANSYKIYNGSGLPIKKGTTRTDNLSTCTSVLKIILGLEESLVKHGLVLSDIVAVNGGQDLGTFRTRFAELPELHEAIISKTGTVDRTSTLAGILSLGENMPFAILNHTADTAGARKFQDAFVGRMFHHLGEPVQIPYAKIPIFPWDGTEFLTQAE